MIQVKGLRYNYTTDREIAFQDFEVGNGAHFLLLGNSGSGKTTLLHLVGGLLRTQTGSIRVNDRSIESLTEQELDRFRGEHYGFVFQRNHLLTSLTVEENLQMAPYLAGKSIDKKRVNEVLSHLGLADRSRSRIKELSQGQMQRVAIARAVMNKPSVILADEPTSALDDTSCERVIDLLTNAANENKATLLIATHDQRLKSKISNQILLKA